MFSFLKEFFRRGKGVSTFVVVREGTGQQARQYRVVPRHVLLALSGGALGVAALAVALLFLLPPLQAILPGAVSAEMRENAILNALRIQALQDSLAMQEEYMTQLRQVFLSDIEMDEASPVATAIVSPGQNYAAPPVGGASPNWADHQEPAITIDLLPGSNRSDARRTRAAPVRFPSIVLPALAPVNGFVTRGFDARTGHYGIDIAVEEGTSVRAIGDGYVVMADWTQEGGYAIAIQHSDGYLSVYKHNGQLYKRTGDRVQARDNIAVSGNSGEFTTGPHLHFELWRNGLAQDPSAYLVGI